MEIVWISTGILCIIAAVRLAVLNSSVSKIPVFAVMAFICFIFGWLRHKQRKKA